MTYEIKTSKSYHGWKAVSEAILEETPKGKRILKLRTFKVQGGIATTARAVFRQDQGVFISDSFLVFEGFRKSIIEKTPCKRVTEKAVLEVHKLALQQMDSLIDEAKAFYADPNNPELKALI